jgi:hypothetical protein
MARTVWTIYVLSLQIALKPCAVTLLDFTAFESMINGV